MPLCDKIFCYDNSGLNHVPIFEQEKNIMRIFLQDLYEKILRQADEYEKTK